MTCAPRAGFTLIEVVAATLVFAAGVLMLLGLSTSLSTQMEISAVATTVTLEVQERMDSLGSVTYGSLALGSSTSFDTIRGIPYKRTVDVTQFSPLLRQITVTMTPVTGRGPSRTSTTYSSDRW